MPSKQVSRRTLLGGTALAVVAGVGGYAVLGGPDPEPFPDATPGANDWPASGYDSHNTRYNTEASPPRSEPTVQWSREFTYCHEPVVRGSRLVVNADNSTIGLRATDGEFLWEAASEPWGHETPTLGTERAYVTGTDCAFGVDLETGDETWHGQPCHGANTASGTLANGRLYLEYGGFFSALDGSGRPTWASRHDVQGSPAVGKNTAYIATVFTVEAIDLTAAATEWPWEDPDDDQPAYAEKDAATKWSVPPESRITGPRIYKSPAVSDATVYATFEHDDQPGGSLRALTRMDGKERWAIASPPDRPIGGDPVDAPNPVGSPVAPVVTDDLVITSLGDRRLRALTPGGESEWTVQLDHDVTDLAGAGDVLYAILHDQSVETTVPGHASLVAFDLGSGERLWEKQYEDHVENLAVAGNTIYTTVVTDRNEDMNIVSQEVVALR